MTICNHCGEEKPDVRRRRQNTYYVSEESNYITVCEECFERAEEMWEEMWSEYHGR